MEHPIRQINSKDFPALLNEMNDPPKTLFVQGILPQKETKLLTVVGSRKCTSYGRDVIEYLIGGLRGQNISIVSGLALGIDGYAHKAAMEAHLHTMAIPGSGLNESVLYPQTHVTLAKQILKNDGALVSELEPNERAAPWTFPKRNRIMAGIAHAVLIIEATERSGTLITARLAVDYNRELLVVPASIFANSSRGAHQFLKLGATPVTEPKDILESLGISSDKHDKKFANTKEILNLSKNELEIYELLESPLPRDELIQKLSFSVTDANVLLSRLELDEIIVEKFGTLRRSL